MIQCCKVAEVLLLHLIALSIAQFPLKVNMQTEKDA
nr:MAG TPA: hypothetical protein [Caudoviricetes sp.]